MMALVFTGDPALDTLNEELATVERNIDATRAAILMRLEHGVALNTAEMRPRMRAFRELLAKRAVLRELMRSLEESSP